MNDETFGCSVCHRALYPKDADEQGRCPDCRPTTDAAADDGQKLVSNSEPSDVG